MSYAEIIRQALKEDIGRLDITTSAVIPKNKFIKAAILAKEPCVVCGLGVAAAVFKAQDKSMQFKPAVKEGQLIKKGRVIAYVWGRARNILTAERVALNFISLLCAIATKTRVYVQAIRPYKAKILDTRKTIPGLRLLQKYAVRIGGGFNHRLSLDQMVLIKDNHLKIIGGYKRLPRLAKGYTIETEVKNLKEFRQALKLNPDIIMLDNMSLKDIKSAVKIRNNLSPTTYHLPPKLEASGGINLRNIKRLASLGIEMISVGDLTHSVKSVDISLEIL